MEAKVYSVSAISSDEFPALSQRGPRRPRNDGARLNRRRRGQQDATLAAMVFPPRWYAGT